MLAGAVVAREAMRVAGVDRLEVCGQGLREGMFYERYLAPADPPLIADVRRTAVRNLAANYHYDRAHAEHVAQLATSLHESLAGIDVIPDDPWERDMLWAAGVLHDTGTLVDYNDHHKHGHYLVLSAGLPGYTHRELAVVATLVRSHRKRLRAPGPLAPLLADGDRERIRRMAACLRLAEALERTRDRAVRRLHADRVDGVPRVRLEVDGDPDLAAWSAEAETTALARALDVELRLEGEPFHGEADEAGDAEEIAQPPASFTR
jgi:exopolyphosphatase/guanosine-5'-triphosphate,3'-diphosphate pyrophosphatase